MDLNGLGFDYFPASSQIRANLTPKNLSSENLGGFHLLRGESCHVRTVRHRLWRNCAVRRFLRTPGAIGGPWIYKGRTKSLCRQFMSVRQLAGIRDTIHMSKRWYVLKWCIWSPILDGLASDLSNYLVLASLGLGRFLSVTHLFDISII